MSVELAPSLEKRLSELAQQRSMSMPQLVEEVLTRYVTDLDADGLAWVKGTQQQLARVWPAEDFSAWRAGDAS